MMRLLVVLSVLLGGISLTASARAATLLVDRLDDTSVSTCSAAPNDCTLRGAVDAANANISDTDTIAFAPDVFAHGQTLTLNAGELTIRGPLVISGPIASGISLLTLNGNNASRIFTVKEGANLTLSYLRLTGGNDGALVNDRGTVTINNSLFVNNSADNTYEGSGALANYGKMTINTTTFSRNKGWYALTNRGTMTMSSCTISKNSGDKGVFTNWGTLTINSSTFANNHSMEFGGALINQQYLTINTSTFYGNSANFRGGALYIGGTATINSSTFSHNDAEGGAGGAICLFSNTSEINNCILADNTALPDEAGRNCPNIYGNFAGDYNLIDDPIGTTLTGHYNVTGKPARLGPLSDNGGPTQTLPLLSGSPAIDAGNAKGPDQCRRGRPFDNPASNNTGGNLSDIGAVEQGATELLQSGPDFIVKQADDHDDGTCGVTDCTLREAIAAANANEDVNSILFSPLFTHQRTITLGGNELVICSPVTLNGPTSRKGANLLTISGNKRSRIFNISDSGIFTLSHLNLTRGWTVNDDGGALTNSGEATISNCTLSYNAIFRDANEAASGVGGAIINRNTMRLSNCTLLKNKAGCGGALFNSGSLLVEGCLFVSNNGAQAGGALYNGTDGYQGGEIPKSHAQIQNSTFLGNSTGVLGGGIYNAAGLMILDSCTVVDNRADKNLGSGIFLNCPEFLDQASTLWMRNSLVVGNLQSDGSDGTDIDMSDVQSGTKWTPYTSRGNNFVGDGDGVANFSAPGDSRKCTLATAGLKTIAGIPILAFNGGPTRTIALIEGSSAINAGATQLPTDQRGVVRPQGGVPDIGAFEFVGRNRH